MTQTAPVGKSVGPADASGQLGSIEYSGSIMNTGNLTTDIYGVYLYLYPDTEASVVALDFGSAVTLSEIEDLGEANLPATMYEAITTIATPNVRNIATIGGNICLKDFYGTIFASLLALDARLEFQNSEEAVFKNLTRFDKIPKETLLTRIRLPIEEWEMVIFRRVGPQNMLNELSASFVFLANSLKNQVSDLRIAFAGSFKFRDIELENKLIGAHLPLSEATISSFLSDAQSSFDKTTNGEKINPILRQQFCNLLKYSLEQLT